MIYDPTTDPQLKSWLVKNLEPMCVHPLPPSTTSIFRLGFLRELCSLFGRLGICFRCDAEPGALGDYILALLKHNTSEPDLRVELGTQLEEFLEKGACPHSCFPSNMFHSLNYRAFRHLAETQHFINLLFNALRSKSYLPYNTSPPPTPTQPRNNSNPSAIRPNGVGIPIPLEVLPTGPSNPPSNPRKRGLDNPSDDHEFRKGPRLSNDPGFPRPVRGGRGQWDSRGGGRGRDGGFGEPSGLHGGNRPQQYRPPDQAKRGICRDYHSESLFESLPAYTHSGSDNGYCSRGAFCKYSHGEDAVVPSQLMGMGSIPPAMLPFMSMMGNAMFPPGMNGVDGGNAYDPNERMDMQRAPMMRRQDVPVPNSGELPVIQDLTPWAPPEERVPQQNPEPKQPGPSNMAIDPAPSQDHPPPGQFGHHPYGQGQGSRGRRGRGGPRLNGTFPSHAIPSDTFSAPPSDSHSQSLRPDRRQDKTLVVEKIPEDRLSLGAVNEWFKQFGTVTNIAVDPPTAKALVTFAEHDQAWKAWKSEEAVFGNRFVKVYWHRPLEGRGGRGVKALEVSATLVGKLKASEERVPARPAANGDAGPAPSTSSVPVPPKKPAKVTSSNLQELTAKQERLQQMISEQKALMSQLGSATAEEKKEIMAKLRKLGEDMKAPQPAPAPAPAPPVEKQEDVEMAKGDQEASKKEEGEGHEESTEELQAKLARLKEEVIVFDDSSTPSHPLTVLVFQAASLGISEADQSYSSYGGYTRPWRGRGRGRAGHFRGRGGPPRASMKLDNRPRKLLVKGVPEESVEIAQNWYGVRISRFLPTQSLLLSEGLQTTNGLETVERLSNGDLVVSFKTRTSAEQVSRFYLIGFLNPVLTIGLLGQGQAKGTNMPTVGQIEVSWHVASQSTPAPSEQSGPTDMGGVVASGGSALVEKGALDEEAVASGWGDDGEDGMGML